MQITAKKTTNPTISSKTDFHESISLQRWTSRWSFLMVAVSRYLSQFTFTIFARAQDYQIAM